MIFNVQIDNRTWKMVQAELDGKKLVGECNMCGKCCWEFQPECAAENLVKETQNGVPVQRCKLHGPRKPVCCVLWPLPDSEIPEGCTLRYE